jgi:choice-of-anchor B domain-containing protein
MKKSTFTLLALVTVLITSAQLNMQQLGLLTYSSELSDIWGYADGNGNEYALVGVYNGLSIVNITDPANPVEVFFGSGPNSIWRDIKTWGHYAYVSNETNDGVYIVDMSPLPGPITSTANFTGNNFPFTRAHNLFIDEYGKLYIFGANSGAGGAIICDLTVDPMNPVELGRFNSYYLHDGMARGDTLWGAAIYQGVLSAIDVSDPANPVVMGTKSTPGQFTHNTWVSDNGQYVFTTDEVSGGFLGAYDVTSLSNIVEVGKVQSSPGSGVIPHNVHFINDFIVTSYYTDGVTIHDVSRPDNMILVGHFDTSPAYSGNGFHGCWGVYPWLPSGNILATDIEEGLYILKADYPKAFHLNGVAVDSITGDLLFNVQYEVTGTNISGTTLFNGTFKFGTLETGVYDIHFTKDGYQARVLESVEFINGGFLELEVNMAPEIFTGMKSFTEDISINLYPNPFESSFRLELVNDMNGPIRIEIFDLTGQVVESLNITGNSRSVNAGAALKPGLYFVRITNQMGATRTERVVKY